MQLSTNQIQKIQEIEQKLAEYRKLYNDWPARRKIILLQVGLLKNAYYKITGQEYQKQKDLRNSISKA